MVHGDAFEAVHPQSFEQMFQRCHAVAGSERCSRIVHHEGQTHLLGRCIPSQGRLRSVQSSVNALGHQFVARQNLHFLLQSVRLLVLEIKVIVLNYPRQLFALPNMLQA